MNKWMRRYDGRFGDMVTIAGRFLWFKFNAATFEISYKLIWDKFLITILLWKDIWWKVNIWRRWDVLFRRAYNFVSVELANMLEQRNPTSAWCQMHIVPTWKFSYILKLFPSK